MEKRCGNCRWWKDNTDKFGECDALNVTDLGILYRCYESIGKKIETPTDFCCCEYREKPNIFVISGPVLKCTVTGDRLGLGVIRTNGDYFLEWLNRTVEKMIDNVDK